MSGAIDEAVEAADPLAVPVRPERSRGLPPILPVVLLALVPLLTFRQLVHAVEDPDVFWHLRMGDYVLGSWTFSGPDPFTSFASEPLVLHEWPLEVVYTLVERATGFAGLVVLQALGPALLLAALYYLCRRDAAPLLGAPLAVVAWMGTSGSFTLRPQIASFILLALVTRAWLQTASDRRARWWLVPLSWVWAAVHGLWISGAVVGVLVILGMLLDAPREWRRLRGPLLVVSASWLVAGLTPLGPQMILKPFTQASAYSAFVTEWSAPPLFTVHSVCTLGLLVVTAVVWARSVARPSWVDVLLWLAALGAALLYSRTVAIGAILAAAVAARALSSVLPPLPRPRRRTEVLALAGGLVALLVAASLAAPGVAGQESRYPGGLDSALDALPAGARVLNAYELGGWLLWRHPDLSPIVDGREDVYSVEHLTEYGNLLALRPGWKDAIRRDDLDAAILPRGAPLEERLASDSGWREVGADAGYVLLVPGAAP